MAALAYHGPYFQRVHNASQLVRLAKEELEPVRRRQELDRRGYSRRLPLFHVHDSRDGELPVLERLPVAAAGVPRASGVPVSE